MADDTDQWNTSFGCGQHPGEFRAQRLKRIDIAVVKKFGRRCSPSLVGVGLTTRNHRSFQLVS